MRCLAVLILLFALNNPVFGQETAVLSGRIVASSANEAVPLATIRIIEADTGTAADADGAFSITLPKGSYTLVAESFDFLSDTLRVLLDSDRMLTIKLEPIEIITEVIVTADRNSNVNSTRIGQIELNIDEIKKLPAFMGEVDVIKTIQLLPGVSSVSEGGQGFYVRGGGPDQNLVLVDEALVYNPSHLFGFFSVFNADAVKSVNLIKGGMPANYGGRLSSVLEVQMNEGNTERLKVTGGLGLISSRLTLSGPTKNRKGSFIVSGRRTYIDLFMKAFIKDSSPFAGTSYYFYDFNAKFNYRFSDKDKIYVSGYYGRDFFNFGNRDDDFNVKMPWGNAIAAAGWTHRFGDKLFMNTTATFTDYLFSFGSQQDDFVFELKSGIRDIGGKYNFAWFPNPRHKVRFGIDYTYHTFTPVGVSAKQDDVVFDTGLAQRLFSHESAIYIADEYDVTESFRVNAGLRYSMFHFTGPFTRYVKGIANNPDSTIEYGRNDLIKFYNGLEPRIAARYLLKDNSSLKAGYMYNYQYIHLTSLSAVSLPTDIWYPSTDIAKPQKGWQASIGYFRNFFKDNFESSVELYYKGMDNLIEFRQGALPSDNVNDNTDNLLTFGKGWSYGAELFIKKRKGRYTGWIGYTWSKTERKFPALQADPFPAKYDRRHDLTLVGTYELNPRWTFSFSFVFATGNTLTLPTSWYVQDQELLFNYGARNSTRMAPYHRLDLSATWYDKPTKTVTDSRTGETKEIPKRFRQNVNFSVYNIYNRANPYFLYIDNDGDLLKGDFKISVKQVSLFPVLPSVTWNFEF
jgi:hypothetical protein